jgi:hypothetical protein
MNDKNHTLPSPDDFAKFVTGAEFEDALQGIRKDWGKPATTNGERCGRNVKSDRSSSKSYFTSVII